MIHDYLSSLYSLDGKVAVMTGASGTLGSAMARGLAQAGAKVAIVGRRREQAESTAAQLRELGAQAIATPANVLDKEQLQAVKQTVLSEWGQIDILVNAAGGTNSKATVAPDQTLFGMDIEAMQYVVNLNLWGTILPSMIFGESMAQRKEGCIVNISSMTVARAMTRAIAYSAGKAGAENFTRWLAVELALKYGEGLRVNAIAPGFFVAEQNRSLLLNDDGSLTTRGQLIIQHTPARRFGQPDDLIGALVFLCSPAARFVNGAVLMVDGGASAFTGI